MAATEFGTNHALAVKLWSDMLDVEAEKKQYFSKFMGLELNNMWVVKEDLNKEAGDKLTFGLEMRPTGDGAEDDNRIEGTDLEVGLQYFSDSLFISQRRKTVGSKGKASEQRVPYNMRLRCKNGLQLWFTQDYDEFMMMALAGKRGIDTTFHVSTSWTGRPTASPTSTDLTDPDSEHLYYAKDATGSSDLAASDIVSPAEIEKLVALAETIDPMIQPLKTNEKDGGEDKFIYLMHNYCAFDLRTSYSVGDWGDIRKNTDGKDSLIYKNSLGEIDGVILHKHRNVIRYTGDLTTIACNLFLGAEAGVIGWGGGGDMNRYFWNEETDDRGNQLMITAASIWGCKRVTYNSKAFGMFRHDASCATPTTA